MVTAALFAVAIAGGLSVQPARDHLVLGRDAAVDLEIELGPGTATPELTLTTNAGTIEPAVPAGPGKLRARLLAPQERHPQVALVLVEARTGQQVERAWTSVAIHANEKIKLATKPGAKVEAWIGEAKFGPLSAGRGGEVAMPLVIPPGVQTIRVRSVDRLGNEKHEDVSLDPPPYQRVRIAPVGQGASFADPAPLPLELFAVDEAGRPWAGAALELSASLGQVGAVSARGAGVYGFTYSAPKKVGEGVTTLRASLPGLSPKAGDAVAVPLRPGPPTQLEVALSLPEWQAGSNAALEAKVALRDQHQNAVPPGPVRLAGEGWEGAELSPGHFRLKVADRFEGRAELVVRAEAAGLQGEARLPLRPAAPKRAVVALERRAIRAGEAGVQGQITVVDGFDNPVPGLPLQASAGSGEVAVAPDGSGYRIQVSASRSAPAGRLEVAVSTPAHGALGMGDLEVLPPRQAWGLAVGPLVRARSNLAHALSASPALELSTRLAASPLELFARGELSLFQPAQQAYPAAGADQLIEARLLAPAGLVGLRLGLPLAPRSSLVVSAAGGVRQVRSELLPPRTEEAYLDTRWAPAAAVGVGTALDLGPGRLLVEAVGAWEPVSGPLSGNVGGVGLGAGYLIQLR
jgi:hypothetical protein